MAHRLVDSTVARGYKFSRFFHSLCTGLVQMIAILLQTASASAVLRSEIVEFLIDHDGKLMKAWTVSTDEAIWEQGFVHIVEIPGAITVSMRPDLVQGIGLCGACDEIARLPRARLFLRVSREKRPLETFERCADAFYRMWSHVAAAGNVKPFPRDPLRAQAFNA